MYSYMKGGDKECTIVQKKNWYRSGGFDVPLFVPHTPNGELAKRMKEVEAKNQQGRKIWLATSMRWTTRKSPKS